MIMLCSVEKSSPVVILIKFHQHACLELFWTVICIFFTGKWCWIFAYFSLDLDGMAFLQEKSIIMDTGLVFEPEALVYYC